MARGARPDPPGSSMRRPPTDPRDRLSGRPGDDGVVWEEPPAPHRGKTALWELALRKLGRVQESPGRWARVVEAKTNSSADHTRKQLIAFADLYGCAAVWDFRHGKLRDDSELFGVWAMCLDESAAAS